MAENKVSIKLLTGEKEEMLDLQRCFEEVPDYMNRITGLPPGPSDAQSTFSMLPEGKTYDDKFTYGIYLDKRMVGCIDIIRAFPDAETAALGLLMISEKFQKKSIGFKAYQLIEDEIRNWKGIKQIIAWIVRTNDIVIPFWEKQGFKFSGNTNPYKYSNVKSETLTYYKELH